MAARISDRISGSTLANDEAIQAYEADGVTLVELVKVNASDQISIAADGQDVVIGGTLAMGANSITSTGTISSGAITASGEITANGGIALGDNDKATFGDGDDLKIYHSSSSFIREQGNGGLYIDSDGGHVTIRVNSSEKAVEALNNGAVNLYHDNSEKLATTSTGINVTGTVTATGGNSANWNTAFGWGNHALQSYATETYVGTQISNLVDSSPAALNTLNELAAAIGDDANFSTTVTNNIATKLPLAGGTLTGNLTVTGQYRQSTAPATYAHANADDLILGTTVDGVSGMTIVSGTSGYGQIFFSDGTSGTAQYDGYMQYQHSNTKLCFGTAGVERMSLNTTEVSVVGDVKASGAFTRTIPNGGYLEGTHTSLGTTASQTNPIYIIGSGYQPFQTTLNNMYGIGYTHTNASFINFTGASGWGQYAASSGVASIWLGSDNGVISSTGEHYVGANKVWHAGDAVVATSLTAGAKTIAGNLTVGNTTSSNIYMQDTDEGYRTIHCNSSRIGFLSAAGAWSAYSRDSGVWSCDQGLNVTGAVTSNNIVTSTGGYATSHVTFSSLNNPKSGFYDGLNGGTPTATWYSLVAMAHHNANHGHQIAGSFYSAGDIYNRNNNNGTLGAWAKIYNTSNDGSGSGLDADTVDGVQASALCGKAGFTMTGLMIGRVPNTTTIASSNDSGSISIRGNTTKPAVMTFHRGGAYAVNFGLSTANKLELGGWSAGGIKHTWDFAGNYTATGNITAYSDIRIKENIEVIPEALDKVCQLSGYTFDRTDFVPDAETGVMPETRQTGVIAQEVLKVLPEAVAEMDDGKLTVAYGNMVGLLIESIKELKAEIDTLKAQIGK